MQCNQLPPEGERGYSEMFPTFIFVGEETLDATRVYQACWRILIVVITFR